MDKRKKRNGCILPNAEEIAQTYQALGLSHMLKVPYDRNEQLAAFRKVSLFTDTRPCYATGNTKPYKGDF